MILFEAFIKFSTVGLLVAIGLLLWRDGRRVKTLRFALPLCAAMICTFLTTGHPSLSITGDWATPLRLFDMFNALIIWWFGLTLFDDEFELGWREVVVSVLYIAVMLPSRLHYLGYNTPFHDSLPIISSAFSLLIMADLVVRALKGRKDDLFEPRRALRKGFALSVALVLSASIVTERVADYLDFAPEHSIWVTYLFTFPIVIWGILWLTKLRPEVLALAGDAAAPGERGSALDASQQRTFDRLIALMDNDKTYQQHGLSIGDLSHQIDLPEHQLRQLINRALGYRNFTHFLNHFRLKAVKQALNDPAQAHVPILTLALDAGFSSLAPFNRAFKMSEGVTPSEYRQKAAESPSLTDRN